MKTEKVCKEHIPSFFIGSSKFEIVSKEECESCKHNKKIRKQKEKKKVKRLKTFSVITNYNYGRNTFLTKGRNGKEAILNLFNHSSDFENINDSDTNNMIIIVEHLKSRTNNPKSLGGGN